MKQICPPCLEALTESIHHVTDVTGTEFTAWCLTGIHNGQLCARLVRFLPDQQTDNFLEIEVPMFEAGWSTKGVGRNGLRHVGICWIYGFFVQSCLEYWIDMDFL